MNGSSNHHHHTIPSGINPTKTTSNYDGSSCFTDVRNGKRVSITSRCNRTDVWTLRPDVSKLNSMLHIVCRQQRMTYLTLNPDFEDVRDEGVDLLCFRNGIFQPEAAMKVHVFDEQREDGVNVAHQQTVFLGRKG